MTKIDFNKKVLNELQVELSDEFDKNFERKSFFTSKWPQTRFQNSRGSLMLRSARLRKSLRGRILPNGVGFSSSMAYARIHNEGGKIHITPKMRRFFWAKYYEYLKSVTFSVRTRQLSGNHSTTMNDKAQYWRNMAMIRKDSINIPQRQFVGHHARVNKIVKEVADRNVAQLIDSLSGSFKQHLNNR